MRLSVVPVVAGLVIAIGGAAWVARCAPAERSAAFESDARIAALDHVEDLLK